MVVRINDNTTFMAVKDAINETDIEQYWTGLR